MPLVRRSIEGAAAAGSSQWMEIDEETIERSFEFSDDGGEMDIDGPSYQEGMDVDDSLYQRSVEEKNQSEQSSQHAFERLSLLHTPSPHPAPAEASHQQEDQPNNTTIPPPFVFNAPPGTQLQLPARRNTSPRDQTRFMPRGHYAPGIPGPLEMEFATREERLYGTVAELLAVSTRHHQVKHGLYTPTNQPATDPFPERERQFSETLRQRKREQEEKLVDDRAAQYPIPMFQISLKSWFARSVVAVLITPVSRLFSRKEARKQREKAQVYAVPLKNGKRRCALREDVERSTTPHIAGNFEGQPATAAPQPSSTAPPLAAALQTLLAIARQESALNARRSPKPRVPVSRLALANRARKFRLAQAPDLSCLSERSKESESPRDLTNFDASLENCLAASPLVLTADRRTGRDEQQDTTQVATPDVEVESVALADTSVSAMTFSEASSESPAPVVRSWAVARQASEEEEAEKDARIDLLTRRARTLVLSAKSKEDGLAQFRAEKEASRVRREAKKAALEAYVDARLAERARQKLEYELEKNRAQEEARARRHAQFLAEEAEELAEENAWLKAQLAEGKERARAEQEAQAKRDAERAEDDREIRDILRRAAEREAAEAAPRPVVRAGPIFADEHIIVQPSDAMSKELDAKMHSAQANEEVVATTVTGTELDRIAIARVLGGASGTAAWLSDATVNAWMLCLTTAMNENRGWKKARTAPTPPFVAYSSAWYDQIREKGAAGLKRWTSRLGIKDGQLSDVEQIFFPICMGSHWTLLVVHGKTRTIEYLDSLGGNGTQPIAHIRSLLEAELGDAYKASEWSVARSRSQHQTNGDDCGMFTCFNALAAVRGVAYREITAAKMPLARRLMASILVNGGFTGDAKLS